MPRWTLGELARAAHADIHGGALPEGVAAVGTDSRSLPPASLFVALRGPRFDGHRFVQAAIDAGARAVLVDRTGAEAAAQYLESQKAPWLVVDDTLKALGDLAQYHRRTVDKPVVAITGSNGKTTTKELLASALGQRGGVHRNAGNFNNLIGLPLTVLSWKEATWAAVLEMGMNAPGEIARLTEIAAPEVGVVTNVAAAHLEGLGSVEAVARAKAELYAGLSGDAVAIVNADDPVVQSVCRPQVHCRGVTFGAQADADVRILETRGVPDGVHLRMDVAGSPVETTLPLIGAHNGHNAAAAAAAAWVLGVSEADIARGLASASVPDGRLRLRKGPLGVQVLDDTYNANPESMRAAFAALVDRASGSGRCVAVLGDMLELGDDAPRLHREVGYAAAALGIDWVLALGEHSQAVADGARQQGTEASAFEDLDTLLGALEKGLASDDWILVKGSRGMRMERVVLHLVQHLVQQAGGAG